VSAVLSYSCLNRELSSNMSAGLKEQKLFFVLHLPQPPLNGARYVCPSEQMTEALAPSCIDL
jgi:hypothetical protein